MKHARKLIGIPYTNPINYSVSDTPPPFFDLACSNGQNGDFSYKLGAVIFQKRRLICTGWNHSKTHPIQYAFRNRPDRTYLHAEIHAIVRSKRDLEGCSITIGRTFQDGHTLGSSRACAGCRLALEMAGIKTINYYDGKSFVSEYL